MNRVYDDETLFWTWAMVKLMCLSPSHPDSVTAACISLANHPVTLLNGDAICVDAEEWYLLYKGGEKLALNPEWQPFWPAWLEQESDNRKSLGRVRHPYALKRLRETVRLRRRMAQHSIFAVGR